MKKILVTSLLVLATTTAKADFIPSTQAQVEAMANAIYRAEGGANTRYPYGIKSVSCVGPAACRAVCIRTIKNNVKRWRKAGQHEPYLTFLWHRYCPPAAHALNKHWLKNVKFYLKHQ
jgi:hypothetical protein